MPFSEVISIASAIQNLEWHQSMHPCNSPEFPFKILFRLDPNEVTAVGLPANRCRAHLADRCHLPVLWCDVPFFGCALHGPFPSHMRDYTSLRLQHPVAWPCHRHSLPSPLPMVPFFLH